MSKVLPLELQANIRSLRFMILVVALCGVITILGIPWALIYFIVAYNTRPTKLPNRPLLIFTAIITLPVCVFIVPIFLEIYLWRTIKRINAYEVSGDATFRHNSKWKKLSFLRRYKMAASMIAVMLLLIILVLPLPHTSGRLVDLPYSTQYTQDANLELGETQTRTPGANGQGIARQKIVEPVYSYLLGMNASYSNTALPTQTTQAPVNQIVAQGTKKYQYMWCSTGAYRYYSNDQFKAPSNGFTHKSKDYCADNGQGHMTGLADTAPPQQTTQTIYRPSYYSSPTYTTCHEYSFMNELSCTTY